LGICFIVEIVNKENLKENFNMKKLILISFLLMVTTYSFAQENNKNNSNLKEFVGTYKMESFFEVAKITLSEGSLYAEMDSNGMNKLNILAEADTFKSESSYGSIFIFLRDSTNKVIGIKLKIMDNEVSGTKNL
jgi:hypothetical protein